MSRHRRGRRGWPVTIVMVVLAAAIAAGLGTAVALWVDQSQTGELQVSTPVVGFAVSQGGSTQVSAAGEPVQFSLGQVVADQVYAGTLDGNGQLSLALPFSVTLLTSAGYAMDYALSMDDPETGEVFGSPGQTSLFQVSDPVECTVSAADTASPYTLGDTVTGIAQGSTEVQTQIQNWCLVMSLTPTVITTTATASGTDSAGQTVNSTPETGSTWSAYLTPDAQSESPVTVTLTPDLIARGNLGTQ